ncbi:hypothetical protein Pcinc_020660 [Petrolisthes cinctipes]|uniref:Uncharacterized protein n=1 Tax=Petrolisthes cinctipes TaxID=88211 RepID=A0AAE1FHH3_PETCI|nr:hypothetical protein Pcinc_020660 [Petrolisthes cinctipes]
METFCSLYLIERELNDVVRRSVATGAKVSGYADLRPCNMSDRTAPMTIANGYEVLTPDPLEDPKTLYVDVRVIITDARQHYEETAETVTKLLKNTGPWTNEIDDDDLGKKRVRFMSREEEWAGVNLEPCHKSFNEFYRRTSLFNLAKMIADAYRNNESSIAESLFEPPGEITLENSLLSLLNRSRFTKEALKDWFFELDTYSKCITLVEAFSNSLHP